MCAQANNGNAEKAPLPNNEIQRVLELVDLDLDYTDLQKSLKDLSRLAAYVAGTRISLVNLIDSYTQWSVSNYGADYQSKQIPREESICQYTILKNKDEFLEVKSLKKDEQFNTKGYVVSNPDLEYYFGIPLTTDDGNNIGVLCVLDTETKELAPEKIELLKIISNEIVKRLESIHKISELKQTLKDISDLPKKVLHDIRGPVGGIIGLAEIIKDEAEQKNFNDIIELIELINQGGNSVLELADEILTSYSQDKLDLLSEPEKHQFNLLVLKEKLKELFEPQARVKGVTFNIEISEENKKIPFPKYKLLQIVGNLISNAIKFTPENGEVSTTLGLNEHINDQYTHILNITVQDTGIGMDPGQVEAIQNEEIDQLSTKGTDGEKGFGFGIQLVKHLTQTLDGKIKVSSDIEKGSTIRALIPFSL